MDRPEPRGKFRRRLTIVAIALAVVPVIGVGWNLIAVNEHALEDTNRELLFSVIDDVSHTLDLSVSSGSVALTAIGSVLGNEAATGAERIALTKQLVAALPELSAVGFYDDHGVRFDVARRIGDTTPIPDELPEAMRRSADANKTAIGSVIRGANGPSLPIVQPVRVSGMTWYAYAPISLVGLDQRVAEISRDRFDGDLDAVFVVDRQLHIVSHPDPEQAQAMAIAQVGILQGLATTPSDRQFLLYSTFDTPRGAMVGAVRSLPTLPFAVVAQLPRARALASVPRMRWIVSVVIAVAGVFAALAALLLARRLSAPIARLVAFSKQLAAREFAASADVRTGDELEVLGSAMTAAARSLAASDAKLIEETSIRADLTRYLPTQLVDKIVRREQSLELGGHRRTVTVLFADVASFTALTENHPPEVVVKILNQLFTILTEIVFRHGGTVDKFIGDCVMAFWNAPDDQPDHAARAIAAARDMLRWLEIGNEAWQAEHDVTIHLAIGVNTGDVVVGNFGSENRMTYTCIGDSVNVAARLEGIARPQQILVSRATRDAALDASEYVELGPQQLAGRAEALDVFEVSV